ncbi:alpha/beta fold hydrolase [Sphingomicrobium astaxanthinifaciens]|uniref:alpha/beta fold hydrolase n=1 Tax=Sphingomicrobium astaxanthinifaciens TaxID=1227949 RepID=UPI001FCB010F|nr:alpha/beta hydrolase [Sphingomicrobium astaxanthinifaciens]MCJ7421333.1 alpha/beta hydrolase [Sphingomicrobium astaxanthinifaciens]
MTDQPSLQHLDVEGRAIAYRHRRGKGLTYLFLPGYASDMEGGKATAIDAYAARGGRGCLRLDYSGTGSSRGDFADGTLERWLDEVLAAIDRLAKGSVLLIGSSMGGWLALAAAMRRPDRVAGVLGLAAAPDFTDWGFSEEEKATIAATGRLERASDYDDSVMVTHRGFWESGEALRLLEAPIDFDGPVRFVHGEKDRDVPARVAARALQRLTSPDVQLRLIKNSGHRLSAPHEIAAILADLHALDQLITQKGAADR